MLQFVTICENKLFYNVTVGKIYVRGCFLLKITDIKIRKLFDDESPMKAVVSITLDDQLALHDIKVIYAKEKHFIVMPSKKNPDGTYRDVAHPITAAFREELSDAVLAAYFEALENPTEPTAV